MDIKITDITSMRKAYKEWTSRSATTEPEHIIVPEANDGVVAKIVGPNDSSAYLRRSSFSLILTNDVPTTTPTEKVINAAYLNWDYAAVNDNLEYETIVSSPNYAGSNTITLLAKTGTVEVTATSAATAEPVAKLLLIMGNRNVSPQSTIYYFGISASLGYYYDEGTSSLKKVLTLENKNFSSQSPNESGYVTITNVAFTPAVSYLADYNLAASFGYNKTVTLFGIDEGGESEDQPAFHSEYIDFSGPGNQSIGYSYYQYSSTNTKVLIAGLDEIEDQIVSLNNDISAIGDSIDDIEETIAGIPEEIEDAVDEAVQSLTGSLSSNFVSR